MGLLVCFFFLTSDEISVVGVGERGMWSEDVVFLLKLRKYGGDWMCKKIYLFKV